MPRVAASPQTSLSVSLLKVGVTPNLAFKAIAALQHYAVTNGAKKVGDLYIAPVLSNDPSPRTTSSPVSHSAMPPWRKDRLPSPSSKQVATIDVSVGDSGSPMVSPVRRCSCAASRLTRSFPGWESCAWAMGSGSSSVCRRNSGGVACWHWA